MISAKSARTLTFSATLLVCAGLLTPLALGQGPGSRVGQALDNAGRNIRRGVENAVTRTQMAVAEQDLLTRVYSRIHWEKSLTTSTIEFEVMADGTVTLRGAAADEAAKARAVELVESTVGVTTVVDQIVISKDVRVIEAPAAKTKTTVIERPIGRTKTTIIETKPTLESAPTTKVIVKP